MTRLACALSILLMLPPMVLANTKAEATKALEDMNLSLTGDPNGMPPVTGSIDKYTQSSNYQSGYQDVHDDYVERFEKAKKAGVLTQELIDDCQEFIDASQGFLDEAESILVDAKTFLDDAQISEILANDFYALPDYTSAFLFANDAKDLSDSSYDESVDAYNVTAQAGAELNLLDLVLVQKGY